VSTGEGPDGILLVDKAPDRTSHDVVSRVRRLFETRKVGHAGTLDPNATGLLLLGLGRGTRLLTYLSGLGKTYEAGILLGRGSTTDDVWGELGPIAARPALEAITPERVHAAAKALTGDILQVPSSVSAIKVGGVRAYRRVREGEDVHLAPRPVTVSSFALSGLRRRDDGCLEVDAVIECSSGTYIRALARDLGAALGTGGVVSALRRTRVGAFSVSEAAVLPEWDQDGPRPDLLGLGTAAGRVLPVRTVDAAETRELRFGRPLSPSARSGGVAAVTESGELVAVLTDERGRARPRFVVPAAPAGKGHGESHAGH
jgi:tRNA pseudouridine55 synthase